MVPRSVLEFSHPDEVFNKFYDAVYQKWSRRSHIWTHSLGLISSHKRIHDQWLFFPQKKKCGKQLTCFSALRVILLTSLPNTDSLSVSITFTYLDFNAAEAASSNIFPLIFFAFYRHGRYTQLQRVLACYTHCKGLWPPFLLLSTGSSAM